MDQEEKLKIAIRALRDIANASSTQPHTTSDEFDGDYQSCSGGNFDDAVELGRNEDAWHVAQDARKTLSLIGEGYNMVVYQDDE